MSQSPVSPRHSRHASSIEHPPEYSYDNRPLNPAAHDLGAPLANSLGHQDHVELGALNVGGPSPHPGMGNLADELADAFSDSDEEDESEYERVQERALPSQSRQLESDCTNDAAGGRSGIPSTPTRSQNKGKSQKLLSPHGRDNRSVAIDYDGSEYGSESDLDCAGIPATLVAKIDGIESLARRGTEKYGGADDDVFQRVTDSLRDLGSQLTVEGNASRHATNVTANNGNGHTASEECKGSRLRNKA
ncbi:hypothetical protein E4U13_006514 [Claviceps humidiphila]|uniref:Uncharacterized protein n=1 Tax=Claviceps humidiphila TaxID=1294629 RepID=A0A9P7PU19_9HYPO|nr:hypothetical protein E4U13_006514 [Claviceps humidiphila]